LRVRASLASSTCRERIEDGDIATILIELDE